MPKKVTRGLKRQLKLEHHNNLSPRWFSYKNNHVFKSKEFNRLMFLTLSLNSRLQQTYLFIRCHHSKRKDGNHEYLQLVIFLAPQHSSQQWRLNSQLGGQHIAFVQNVDEVFTVRQRWQFAILDYYIPKAIVPFQSTPITKYYTSKPIFTLNPIAKPIQNWNVINLKTDWNIYATWSKDLHTNLVLNHM